LTISFAYKLHTMDTATPSAPTASAMLAPAAVSLAGPFAAIALDKNSAEPFWRQLYVQVSAMIASGVVSEGVSLPSERDLAQALGISRATAKRCYDELRRFAQLSGRGRGGSVVQAVQPVQPSLGKLKGFTQEMQELGKVPSTDLLERAVVTDRMMASVFGRPSTAQFLRLVRVRKADGVPMTREVAWYDLSLAPALAKWEAMGSAYEFLKTNCKVALGHAEQTVEAVQSSPQETHTFSFGSPQPCLLFKRKTFTPSHQLIEYVEGTFRGDAYVYKLTLET
jgi:GntR family transcriptional regulator